ncbi:IS4 family transposase [Anoxybacillus flavithermus]|uniref:IS4 family transposase n=4 Tax=Anoxybacillus flavithermus TaxID=33934 RepID=A0AAX1ZX24_9BACL|nr:IS4 family transposase [Anoxybacillus flavithermus]MBE2915975.1 IS4 family transposase [Anoxybacillus flavithermus]MBE2925498.1 IS4 family transposase [Anoxybacillus flavithermus]MBE2930862.1 IS4 family transposase [Anoxybacillus flavithermus]MBE2936043.1 IS4 family transposase [Anoxybacillus flavithermus]
MENQMQAWMKTICQLFSPKTLTHLAQETGFIQRKRALTAEAFLTLCAWGDGSLAQQSLQRLCTSLTLRHDCSLSSEGLNQRFTERAVAFLREVFFLLLQRQRPLLWSTIQTYRTCFTRLRILDSTSFLVPADYGEDYRGSVSSGAKIQFEYDLLSGACLQLCVQSANDSDARFAYHAQHTILPNDLCIRDLGFFSVAALTEIDARGAYYITRLRSDMKVYIKENSQWKEWDWESLGNQLKEGESVEMEHVYIGHERLYIPRLIFRRLTEEEWQKRMAYVRKREKRKGKALTRQTLEQKKYHILLTNLPQESFDGQQVYELYSLRWQIELLFKAWKSVFDLEKVKKMKKERFECHVYGTLIAILVTQTFLFQARTYWQQTEGIQISERKALDVLQFYWQQLLLRLSKEEISLSSLLLLLKKHGRKDRRKGKETALDLLVKLGIY